MNSFLLDLLFPEHCVLCEKVIHHSLRVGDYPVCKCCSSTMGQRIEKSCRICSFELTSEADICLDCRTRTFEFEQNISVYPYLDTIKNLILLYKAGGHQRLSTLFAELLLPVLRTAYLDLPIIPVPPRPERVKQRGFDPIGRICRDLSRMQQINLLPLLDRRKKTQEQKTLGKQQRIGNLAQAFFLNQKGLAGVTVPASAVIIDDVFTTGATIDCCASILKSIGVQQVFGLTLARD